MRPTGTFDVDPVLGLTARRVAESVASEFGVSVDAIYSSGRWEPAVTARQVCMYILRTVYGWGFSITARAYGRSNHATAMRAVETVGSKKADMITDDRMGRIAQAMEGVNACLKERVNK